MTTSITNIDNRSAPGKGWLSPFSGAQRRRIMAALRRAHRVLGLKRRHLGAGPFTPGRNAVMAGLATIVASMGFAENAMADCAWVSVNNIPRFYCGPNASAGSNGAALGMDANAAGMGSIAIGNGSTVTSEFGVALGTGSNALVGNSAIAIGYSSKASSDFAIAIGGHSQAFDVGSMAIGIGASAVARTGVALGSYSVALTNSGAIGYDPSGKDRSQEAAGVWKSGMGAVSVGEVERGRTRQINAVAAGTQETDAVNVAQLKAVNAKADAANETANKGWNIRANGDTATQVKPEDTVQFKDGKNVKVTRTGGDITIATADDLTATSITTGANRLDANGLTIASGPSVTVSGINAGGKKVTGVAPGIVASGSREAVNGAQLFAAHQAIDTVDDKADTATATANTAKTTADAANVTANKGWTVQANGDTATQVKPGDAVQFKDGKNVKVTRTGSNITVATADDLTATSLTAGNSRLDTNGLTITNGPAVTVSGINAGGKKVTGVAAGTIASGSAEAVNGGQLFTTNQTIATVDGKADTATATANTAKTTADAANVAANKGWNVRANGDAATQVKPGDAVQFKDGKNVKVTRTGSDITIATADDLTATSLTAGNSRLDTNGLTITNGPSVTVSGINAGGKKVTGVAAGTIASGSADAVNGGQLFATNQAVTTVDGKANTATATANTAKTTADAANVTANKGWNVQANGDVATQVKPEDTVQFKDGKNVKVTRTGGEITIATADNLTATSITTGRSTLDTNGLKVSDSTNSTTLGLSGLMISGGPAVTVAGIDAGSKKITRVAAGSVASGSAEAVNGGQLFATNQAIATVDGKADAAAAIANTATTAAANAKSTADAASAAASAANETANKGWNLRANSDTATQVKPEDTVQFKDGKNIKVTRTGGDITIATADNLTATSITTGKSTLDTNGLRIIDEGEVATLGASGLTIGNGPSVTALGIDAGGKKITGVAAGSVASGSTDAVNGGQLYAIDQRIADLSGGKSTGVQRGSDGIVVLTDRDGTGSAPGAAQKLGNLADGGVAAGSKEAVNGGQLFAANQAIETVNGKADAAAAAASTATTAAANAKTTADAASAAATAANETANKGWTLSAQGKDASKVSPGEAVDLSSSDGNIKVVKKKEGVAFDLADDLTVKNSLSVGNNRFDANGLNVGGTLYGVNGLSIAGGPSILALGIDAGGKKMTGVAAGKLGGASTDAVNGSQLYALGDSLATALGGHYDLATGKVTGVTLGGNGGGQGTGQDSTAIGNGSTASGDNSIAAGPGATASGDNSIAHGPGATAEGPSSTVIGDGSKVTGADSSNSIAIGTGNIVADSSNTTVIGNGNIATGTNDANLIGAGNAVQGGGSNSIVGSGNSLENGNRNFVAGYDNTLGSNLQDNQIIASGGTVADGVEGGVLIGKGGTVKADDGVAIGTGAVAGNKGDVALGAGSITQAVVQTDTMTVDGKDYAVAGGKPASTVSVGDSGNERTITNVAAGRVNADSTDAVNGSQLHATNQAVEQVSRNGLQYDRGADGGKTNTLTLQGGDPNAPVLIANVASGKADTDAVNVMQLKDFSAATLNSSYGYTDTKTLAAITSANGYTDRKAEETLASANDYTDSKFGQLSGQLDNARKEARQAAAIGLAAASLRYDERPGKVSAAVGGGTWGGQGALAVGLGWTSPDQAMRANVSATTAGGQWGVGAGFSFTFN